MCFIQTFYAIPHRGSFSCAALPFIKIWGGQDKIRFGKEVIDEIRYDLDACGICTLIAVMCIGTAALTGCGSDSNSSTANSANSAAAAQTNESVDVTAVADKLKNGIEFKDELAELDEAKIEKIIGISADSYTKAKVYVSSSGGTAEEIDCFEAKDADSAKAIADTLTARVESQKKVFENYVPEEMTKLGDPVLVTNGNYVYLCLSNDNDKAKEIIG